MTAIDQVIGLVSAHSSRDHARFRVIALSIAANFTARSPQKAEQLRKLIEKHQSQALAFMTPLPQATGLLSAPSKLSTLDDMVLAADIRSRLDRVVLKHSRRGELLAQGLSPARKLLLTGPPGVGKSMAAGALAQAIDLPLFRVDLHGVISSHLGETSAKLAKVFDHVRSMPAVYLFDEFDGLATSRSNVGGDAAGSEMRRVVNSLLQFIEDDQSEGLIIAATNYESMLDDAMHRRFDERIVFEVPSQVEIEVLLSQKLSDTEPLDRASICAAVAEGKLGHADVCAALDRVRKDRVLIGTVIDTNVIVSAMAKRARPEARA